MYVQDGKFSHSPIFVDDGSFNRREGSPQLTERHIISGVTVWCYAWGWQ